MKAYSWLVPAITLLAFQGTAQIQEAASPDLVVVDRGQNYRVWQRTITETLPDGETIQRRGGYVELSPGVHYLKEGSWAETKELIEIFQDGAIARQGPHQVIFANNIHSIGTVDLLSSDAKRFRSHLVGLAY